VKRTARLALAVIIASAALVAGASGAAATEASSSDTNKSGSTSRGGFITFSEYIEKTYPDLCADGVVILADAARVTPETRLRLRGGSGNGTLSIESLDADAIQAAYFSALMACPPPG
jgi:hypothetical protein